MIHVPNVTLFDQNPELMTKIRKEKIMTNIRVILRTNIGHFGHKIKNKYRGSKTCMTEFYSTYPHFSRRFGSKSDN